MVNLPLHPSSVRPGAAGLTLHVTGTDFASNAVVNWNGVPLATTFVNPRKLTAIVPAANVASAETANVTVTNPGAGGGTSSPVLFTITAPTPSLTFAASVLDVGSEPGGLVAGDFNNDGITDLAVLNMNQPDSCYVHEGSGTIQILLGNGSGGFSTKSNTCLPDLPGLVGLPFLAAQDFAGNGNLGVAAEWYEGGENVLQIFPGNGNGTLAASSGVGITDGNGAIIPAFADFTNDGSLDLAFAQSDPDFPGLYVYCGNGNGSFNFGCGGTGTAGLIGIGVVAGDFNRDGLIDLAVLNYANVDINQGGAVGVLLGTGGGNFAYAPTQPSTSLVFPVGAVIGDFNGDGILDLAFADAGSTALTVLLGNGDGTFTQEMNEPDAGQTTQFIATADLNGDGVLDLALVDSANAVRIFLGNGNGTFQNPIVVPAGNGASQLAIGDFNGDGRLDLAVANTFDNTVSLLIQSSTAIVSPTSLNFGQEQVGKTSPSQRIYIRNSGSAVLQIDRVMRSGSFAKSSNCGSTLAVGQSCHVDVVFKPTATGPATGTITIMDNAPGGPQTIQLSGTGY